MDIETEHTCQFCYYEYFDSRAYPCSMCVCGEERTDKFQPKGRQNKRKDEPRGCDTCEYGKYGSTDNEEKCDNCSFGTTYNYEPIKGGKE